MSQIVAAMRPMLGLGPLPRLNAVAPPVAGATELVDFARCSEWTQGHGCQAEHRLGQWWAHPLRQDYVLDPAHVRSAATAIVKHNFRANFRDHVPAPRVYCTDDDAGLLLCSWPNGGRPPVPTLYSDEIWTGIEYEVAGLLLQYGEPALALQVIEAVRARYDGTKQNPWNDIECGDHYARAMSSWGLLEAASGYLYHGADAALTFAPVLAAGEFRAPFVTAAGWGTFAQTGDGATLTATLTLAAGHLTLATLTLAPPTAPTIMRADIDGRPVEATLAAAGDRTRVTFAPPVTLAAGDTLTVRLGAGA